MQKELVAKITEMLQAIPAHSDWDIEIVGIDPTIEGLKVVYKVVYSDKRSPIQRMVKKIKYCDL